MYESLTVQTDLGCRNGLLYNLVGVGECGVWVSGCVGYGGVWMRGVKTSTANLAVLETWIC